MQVRVNLGAHKLYRVVFPSCSLSKILLGLCSSLEFLFSILWQEIWVFIYFSLACTSCNFTHGLAPEPSSRRKERERKRCINGHLPPLTWDHGYSKPERKVSPSLNILVTLAALLPPLSLLTQPQWGIAYWQGCERMEKRKIGVLPYSLWTLGGLFSALLGAPSVHVNVPFWAWTAFSSVQWLLEGKNYKLTACCFTSNSGALPQFTWYNWYF